MVLLLGAVAFFASLPFPAIYATRIATGSQMSGFYVLTAGWLGVMTGVFGWYANVFLLAGYVLALAKERIWSLCMFVVAFLLACSSFNIFLVWSGDAVKSEVKGFGPGFYIWIGGIFFVTVGCAVIELIARRKPTTVCEQP